MTDLALTAWIIASIPLLAVAAILLFLFREWVKYGRKPRKLSARSITGEYQRAVSFALPPQIKLPPIIDVSHWKRIPDFSVVSPRPALFITKATEGASFVDDKFIPFFQGAEAMGWRRGCFHFNRKFYKGVRQADHFAKTISPHITHKDFLILDVEEGGEQASELWAWFDFIRNRFSNPVMLYGSKLGLDPIPMTAAEREYFKSIPIWTAGYPWFPDLFTSVPKGYIPDQTKYGPVCLWQYSSHGKVAGIEGDVDLNLATPDFLKVLYGDPDPTPIPDPEPEPTGETMHGTVTTFTNIRADRNKSSADLGDLLTGDRLEYHDELWQGLDGLKYRRLINATRNGAPVYRNDLKAWGAVDAYAYAVNIKDDPTPPAPVPAAGRVRLEVRAEFVNADGVVTHSKTILIDEPLEAVE